MANSWKYKHLSECGCWLSGGTPSKKNSSYWNGNIPWISAKSMKGSRFSDSLLKVTPLGADNGSRIVPKDTILLLVRGSMLHQRIPVGITTKKVAFNQDVKAIIPSSDYVPEFLLYWFLASETLLLSKVENTGIGAGKLDTNVLHAILVPCPSLPEQKRIAGILGAFDDKIENNRRVNETLEQMAAAMFKSWFVDFDPVIDNALAAGNPIPEDLQQKAANRKALGDNKKQLPKEIQNLFPNEFEFTKEFGWRPKGWRVKPVNEILEINPRVKLPKGTIAKYVDMKALPTNGFTISGYIKKEYAGGSKFCKNDVLLARITPCLENGKTSLAYFLDEDEVGFGSTEFIILRGNENIDFEFVYCLARDDSFRKHCIASMVGSSGRQRVQNSCFEHYKIAIPQQMDCLSTFSMQTKPLFEKIIANSKEIQNLTKMRDECLPKLLSNELCISDADNRLEQVK